MPSRSSRQSGNSSGRQLAWRLPIEQQQTTSIRERYTQCPSTATAPTSNANSWPMTSRLAFGPSPQRFLLDGGLPGCEHSPGQLGGFGPPGELRHACGAALAALAIAESRINAEVVAKSFA